MQPAAGSPPTGAPGPGSVATPADSGTQPFPGSDVLNSALFGPTSDLPAIQIDEASVIDAWTHWQTRIGKTNVRQIKNGHVSLDAVANLIRTHR